MDVHPNTVQGENLRSPLESKGVARVGRHWFRAVHVRGGRKVRKTRVGRHWFCAVHVRIVETVRLKPCAATDGPFAKLVAGTVNNATAAAAIRVTLLACFIFLPSRSNWPLGRGENRGRAEAGAESERNAWETKHRLRAGSGRVPEVPTEQRLTKPGRNIAETGAMVMLCRKGNKDS